MAIGGSMAKTMIFSTTPTAADAMTPIWFTITVIIRKEIFTSASCRAIGAPRAVIFPAMPPFSLTSFLVKLKWNPRLCRNHSAAMKLTPWDTTVAVAAPIALRWNPPTSTKSSTIFITQARATKYRGVLESPSPRRIPHTTL